jgi:hypothetical protein
VGPPTCTVSHSAALAQPLSLGLWGRCLARGAVGFGGDDSTVAPPTVLFYGYLGPIMYGGAWPIAFSGSRDCRAVSWHRSCDYRCRFRARLSLRRQDPQQDALIFWAVMMPGHGWLSGQRVRDSDCAAGLAESCRAEHAAAQPRSPAAPVRLPGFLAAMEQKQRAFCFLLLLLQRPRRRPHSARAERVRGGAVMAAADGAGETLRRRVRGCLRTWALPT